jgi:hypothetical protein
MSKSTDPITVPNTSRVIAQTSACETSGGSGFEPSPWTELIPAEEWQVYEAVLEAARKAELPFLLRGAFGLAAYTGRWRNTKDLDLFILAQDRERGIELLE